jgi:hypothetical protein
MSDEKKGKMMQAGVSRRSVLEMGSAALAAAAFVGLGAHAPTREGTHQAEGDHSSSNPGQENKPLLSRAWDRTDASSCWSSSKACFPRTTHSLSQTGWRIPRLLYWRRTLDCPRQLSPICRVVHFTSFLPTCRRQWRKTRQQLAGRKCSLPSSTRSRWKRWRRPGELLGAKYAL